MRRWQDIMPEQDRTVYERAGFCKRQSFGKKAALLIIDVTLGFIGTAPKEVLQSVDEFNTSCGNFGWSALPNIKQLLDVCRERKMPVVYTRGNAIFKTFIGSPVKGRTLPQDPETDRERQAIPDLIAPRPNEWILEKPRASAFFATPLATYLNQQGIESILVAGCVTSGCVRASVVDGFSHGFKVFVVEECVFDRSELSHSVSLYEMNAKYADVVTLNEALGYVQGLQG